MPAGDFDPVIPNRMSAPFAPLQLRFIEIGGRLINLDLVTYVQKLESSNGRLESSNGRFHLYLSFTHGGVTIEYKTENELLADYNMLKYK